MKKKKTWKCGHSQVYLIISLILIEVSLTETSLNTELKKLKAGVLYLGQKMLLRKHSSTKDYYEVRLYRFTWLQKERVC